MDVNTFRGMFDDADMDFVNSLTPDQQAGVMRLVQHVVLAYRAGSKGLTADQLANPEARCRHSDCQLPIAQRNDGSWTHVGPDGQTDVGCRAALFHIDEERWFAAGKANNRNKAQPPRQNAR